MRASSPTEWRKPVGYRIFIAHFHHKRPITSGWFAERDLQIKASKETYRLRHRMHICHPAYAVSFAKLRHTSAFLSCICVYMRVFTYIPVSVQYLYSIHVYIYACIYIYLYLHSHVHIHICVRVYIHVPLQSLSRRLIPSWCKHQCVYCVSRIYHIFCI